MNLLKVKIRKEHQKIFCGPSKIFKNNSWPINICLKYFMTNAKPSSSFSFTLYGLLDLISFINNGCLMSNKNVWFKFLKPSHVTFRSLNVSLHLQVYVSRSPLLYFAYHPSISTIIFRTIFRPQLVKSLIIVIYFFETE